MWLQLVPALHLSRWVVPASVRMQRPLWTRRMCAVQGLSIQTLDQDGAHCRVKEPTIIRQLIVVCTCRSRRSLLAETVEG